MTRLFPTLLLLSLAGPVYSQMSGGAGAGGGRAAAMQKAGKMYGKVIDGRTGKPVDGASVILLIQKGAADSSGGSLGANALTEPNGEFALDGLPLFGRLQLVINAIGFQPYKQTVAFDMAGMRGMGEGGGGMEAASAALAAINKDLGNIRLTPDQSTQLKEVSVVAQTPQFSLQGEKKVFNVDQNINTQGGTVTDVLRNVPGVLVDADGKVTIRNSGPQILVDGRQTTLSLDQIPADAVENLEIIANPSAKFDAESGAGGVLNVVLKKNRKQGYNGNIRAGIESRGGANLGGDLNVRSGKFNISLNANGRRNGGTTWTTTERLDRYATPNVFTAQDGKFRQSGYFGFARLGVDYFISNRSTLSLGFNKVGGSFGRNENIDITTDSLLGLNGSNPRIYSRRLTDGENSFSATSASLGYKHLFQQPGREFTADFNYNTNTNKNSNDFSTDTLNNGRSVSQRTSGSGSSAFVTAQADYVHPISKTGKIEGGLKLTIRNVDNVNNNFTRNAATGDYILLTNPVSDYNSVDRVFAAYVSMSGNLGEKTGYQVGLRGESSDYEGELDKTGQTFRNTYPVSLFPSVFVSQKLPAEQQLQFSYRRGINRPTFFQLFPFADYSDPLNIRQGNAGLRPEFTNSVELTYLKNFTRSDYVSASGYYRHSAGLITTYQSIAVNPFTNSPAVVSTYANIGSTDRYGVELTAQYVPVKWWTILANVNGYNASISTDSSLTTQDNYLSGFAKLNNTFKLSKGITIQLSGTYQSRTNLLPDASNDRGGRGRDFFGGGGPSGTAQGYLDANWFVDASVRKAWGKNDALSLTLSCNDIFGTRRFIQHTENAFFVQDYDRLVNPYMFRLNFSWRFGQMDTDLFRRKNMKGMMDGAGDAMGGM